MDDLSIVVIGILVGWFVLRAVRGLMKIACIILIGLVLYKVLVL